mmetsp:Transcript_24334/g.57056  ORF Transcript_24334/g.57056 Transcript_24334/m.57056 type:complete len:317 (+) Transcript_24334:82-1032(+)
MLLTFLTAGSFPLALRSTILRCIEYRQDGALRVAVGMQVDHGVLAGNVICIALCNPTLRINDASQQVGNHLRRRGVISFQRLLRFIGKLERKDEDGRQRNERRRSFLTSFSIGFSSQQLAGDPAHHPPDLVVDAVRDVRIANDCRIRRPICDPVDNLVVAIKISFDVMNPLQYLNSRRKQPRIDRNNRPQPVFPQNLRPAPRRGAQIQGSANRTSIYPLRREHRWSQMFLKYLGQFVVRSRRWRRSVARRVVRLGHADFSLGEIIEHVENVSVLGRWRHAPIASRRRTLGTRRSGIVHKELLRRCHAAARVIKNRA